MNHPSVLLDVLVVGAGQAGLVTGFLLQQTSLTFHIFDRMERVGESWRRRYDSLVLFSPRAYSALPGLTLDGDPSGYPDKNEIADYLERYSQPLPLSLREGIARVERAGNQFMVLTDRDRRFAARAVIVATGAFQRSVVPSFAGRLTPPIVQLRADSYRNPDLTPRGKVLVVGGGATGRQIARELAASHDVSLSVGHSMTITPQRVLGRDVIEWFDTLGFLRADKASAVGRYARAHESFPGLHLRSGALRRHDVTLRPRMVDVRGNLCYFADGSAEEFKSVIWAIGYRDDSSWLRIPEAVDSTGNYAEDQGMTRVPGLFHVGRSWQTSRASALLTGVSADADTIVNRVSDWLAETTAIRGDQGAPAHLNDSSAASFPQDLRHYR